LIFPQIIVFLQKKINSDETEDLRRFGKMEKYKCPYGIRISKKNFGLENNIKSVPLYAVFCV